MSWWRIKRGRVEATPPTPPNVEPVEKKPWRPSGSGAAAAESRVAALYRRPEEFVHPVLAEPGFSLPERSGLRLYPLDEPGAVEAIAAAHGLVVECGRGVGNVLAIDETIRACKGRLRFKASGGLVVLGPWASFTGSLNLFEDDCVCVVGGFDDRVRPLKLACDFRDPRMRFFCGVGTTVEGIRASMRGEGAAILIGDDGMISWEVWLRPSDMHGIIDLDTLQVINPARDIVIREHVWLAQEVLVLKGAEIGAGSIVGARGVVPGRTHEGNALYVGNPVRQVRQNVTWDREHRPSPEQRRRAADWARRRSS